MGRQKRVVITRAPFRLTFAGGGTDIPDYYKNYGDGASVNASMNRYAYIMVAESFHENTIRVRYTTSENDVTNIDEVQHPSIRESLRFLGVTKGIEIATLADIPSKGTGVGSSSTFTVGLLHALHAYKGDEVTPEQLAKEAIHIERGVLKEAGGKQDQYIAAYGGIRLMVFKKDDTVDVKDVGLGKKEVGELERHLLLMYTGKERKASALEQKKVSTMSEHLDSYKKMAELAHKQYDAFQKGRWQETGKLLHENWLLKKTLASGVSDPYIDRLYGTAIENGAEGGKLLGAGGGGFFLFYANPDKHEKIIEALPELKPEPFGFELEGSKVVYSQGEGLKA